MKGKKQFFIYWNSRIKGFFWIFIVFCAGMSNFISKCSNSSVPLRKLRSLLSSFMVSFDKNLFNPGALSLFLMTWWVRLFGTYFFVVLCWPQRASVFEVFFFCCRNTKFSDKQEQGLFLLQFFPFLIFFVLKLLFSLFFFCILFLVCLFFLSFYFKWKKLAKKKNQCSRM